MDAAELSRIARGHGVRLILEFGSSVTGALHAGSDLDIAVVLDGEDGLERRARLLHDLQALVAGREVDLAVLNHADPLFLKQVTDHCRLLYGTATDLARLKLLAFKRYQDHRKYFDLERAFVARAIGGSPARG